MPVHGAPQLCSHGGMPSAVLFGSSYDLRMCSMCSMRIVCSLAAEGAVHGMFVSIVV